MSFGSGRFGGGTFALPYVAGDAHADPLIIDGDSGSVEIDFSAASLQPDEPAVVTGAEPSTVWLAYLTEDVGGALRVPVDADHYLEVFEGDPEDAITDLLPFDLWQSDDPDAERPEGSEPVYTVSNTTVNIALAADELVLIRVYPKTGVAAPWTFSWTFTARVPELVVQVLSALESIPGKLTVTVTNVEPLAEVIFDLANTPGFYVDQADTAGVLDAITVPIDVDLPLGTRVLTARSGGLFGTATFEVLAGREPEPEPLPAIPAPEPVPPEPVQKWQVQDIVKGKLSTITFPYNPSDGGTPYPPRQYTLATTTSPGGQAITWEGAMRAHEWTFAGYLDTKQFYDTLERLVNSEKRYWLVDHRRQYRLVSFEHFEPEYKRSTHNGGLNDWSFTYRVTVLVYRHLLELP